MEHTTTDLNLAAYLLCSGYVLASTTKSGKQGKFTFSGPIDAQTISEFYAGKAIVEPIVFNTNVRRLTGLVKQENKQ